MIDELAGVAYDTEWPTMFTEPVDAYRRQYVEAKVPFIWDTIQLADDWAQAVGWEPGPPDA